MVTTAPNLIADAASIAERLQRLRIGYAPCSPAMTRPGDRRRFCYYARRRELAFEVADPRKSYDVVVVTTTADISEWARYRGGKVVFELIDSYLALPPHDPRSLLRGIAKFAVRQTRRLLLNYRAGIEQMCRRSDAVICSTEDQARHIAPYCVNVHPILDCQFADVRSVKTSYAAGEVFNLVWEGLPDTLSSLSLIRESLRRLQKKRRVQLHIITDLEYYRYLANRYGRTSTFALARRVCDEPYLYAWNTETFSRIATACDLAVIPIPLERPFWAGKPANKLLLFWRMGVPAVVSATPAYTTAMQAAGVDALCRTADDWTATLERLMSDQAARAENAARGQRYVDSNFAEAALLAQWDAVFASVLGKAAGA